jgi:hypothetical protein
MGYGDMTKLALVSAVSVESIASSVYVLARLMRQPVKVATPLTAGRGVAFVQVREAPADVVIINVTEELSLTTVFPPRS